MKNQNPSRQKHQGRVPSMYSLRLALLLALLPVCVLAVPALDTPAASAYPLTGAGGQLAITLDSPAIVRIISLITGRLICHACADDGSDIVSPADKPQFTPGLAGSGAFISPDGYILTADHVVDLDPEAATEAAAVGDLATRLFNQSTNAAEAFLQNHQQQVEIDSQIAVQEVFLSTAYTGTIQKAGQLIGYPVTRIVARSPVDQQDIAIIQVLAKDMPNLTLAPDSAVSVGERVTALAFPGATDRANLDADPNKPDPKKDPNAACLLQPSSCPVAVINNLLTATQDEGQILQRQQDPTAGLIYKTSPTGTFGSSGGAVIDHQGHIVGFVDQVPADGSYTILPSGELISRYLKQAGITNAGQGTFERAWTQAMSEYEATDVCHWTNAARDLTLLHEQYPQFGAVQPILADAQSKSTFTPCWTASNALVVALAGGTMLLAIAILGTMILRLRKRGRLSAGAVPAIPSMPRGPTSR